MVTSVVKQVKTRTMEVFKNFHSLLEVSVYSKWPSFVGTALRSNPVKYVFSESLRIVDCEGIFIKIKKDCFPNIAPYLPKYRGSLIKFISGRIWVAGCGQHRYAFLTPFSKMQCWEIFITCLVCFWHAVKLWELIKHAISSLK